MEDQTPKKKTWSDFTTMELVEIYARTFDWNLMKKINKVLKNRGVSHRDIYSGTYDRDGKG